MPRSTPFPIRRPGSARNAVFITVGVLGVLAAVYQLARLGPSRYAGERENPTTSRDTILKLAADGDSAEAAWTALSDKLGERHADPTEADLLVLDAAVVARYAQESRTAVAIERLPALRKRRDTLRGAALRKVSLNLEKQALARESANDAPGAEAFYLKAYATERTIEEKFPEAECKNISRLVALESRARVLHAKPIWAQSKADEAAGDTAVAAGDIPAAAIAYEKAWATHVELDRDYRGVTPADLSRTRTLGRKRADALADTLRAAALACVADTEAKAAAGDHDAVPAARAKASATLAELTTEYPESTYAEAAWSAPLTLRLLNAAAARDNLRIEADLAILDTSLRGGDYAAAISLTEGLAREIARVREQFKGSDRPVATTLEHANCLLEVRSELGLIRDVVAPKLRAIPGHPALVAWETETTQALYALVIHADNPSAVRGDNRPVESLTRAEAEAFCVRLGWILGRPVRLPTESEFRALASGAATLPAADLAKAARAIDSGDGTVAPATSATSATPGGFRDALGNVAEWLAGDTPTAPGRVAGGDAECTLAQLAAIPVRDQPATRRSRFVGFRFVVENTPPAPLK